MKDLSVHEIWRRLSEYNDEDNFDNQLIQIDIKNIKNLSYFINNVTKIIRDKTFDYFKEILADNDFNVKINKIRESHVSLYAKRGDKEIKIDYYILANQRKQYKISLIMNGQKKKEEELKSINILEKFINIEA